MIWPFSRKRCRSEEVLDSRIESAQAMREEAAQIRAESTELGHRIDRHLQENHFAERIADALAGSRRGRRA